MIAWDIPLPLSLPLDQAMADALQVVSMIESAVVRSLHSADPFNNANDALT